MSGNDVIRDNPTIQKYSIQILGRLLSSALLKESVGEDVNPLTVPRTKVVS